MAISPISTVISARMTREPNGLVLSAQLDCPDCPILQHADQDAEMENDDEKAHDDRNAPRVRIARARRIGRGNVELQIFAVLRV
jgi:hypothetical protein